MLFEPDYRHILDAIENRRPERLPLYEHYISPKFMEQVLSHKFADRLSGDKDDINEFFESYCEFYSKMTYDTVSFECCVIEVLPGSGALFGSKPDPIQNEAEFKNYPWSDLPGRFWNLNAARFDALAKNMPKGMMAVGGIGNGVFELSEDLVGYEYLCYLLHDQPALFEAIYMRIGDLLEKIWSRFLKDYSDVFAVCRFGDDLGFKSGLLMGKQTIVNVIIPQYNRIIDLVHSYKKPFLLHSCGEIFDVMDELIAAGINGKHSNEDCIACYDDWIRLYSDKIGLLGGLDVDVLCRSTPEDVYKITLALAGKFRASARGYAFGSGNSIPEYVPVDNYLAMVNAVNDFREVERDR